ncbi:MAG: hypothetical protein EOO27_41740 [Comamonadaceae bacterium]|nr:MAG: hypothetical protein EOO27_41740 [Comamonadaceae bacterium]
MSTIFSLSLCALGICIFLLGALAGWAVAHHTIAKECDRLGGFYVGTAIYQCQRATASGKAASRLTKGAV